MCLVTVQNWLPDYVDLGWTRQCSSYVLINHKEWNLHIQMQCISQYLMLGRLVPLCPNCELSRSTLSYPLLCEPGYWITIEIYPAL